jgi:Cu-Zn family superoxide dismutase
MRRRLPLLLALCATLLASCSSRDDRGESSGITDRMFGTPDASAIARMQAAPGSRVDGTVRFQQYGGIVVVRVALTGLPPNRVFGLHVHEKGDCAATGGHFNPAQAPHGRPGRGEQHAGDLRNQHSNGEGMVHDAFETSALALSGPTSVLARAVVVSADADDYTTQPDGKSGPPLACGIIRPN